MRGINATAFKSSGSLIFRVRMIASTSVFLLLVGAEASGACALAFSITSANLRGRGTPAMYANVGNTAAPGADFCCPVCVLP